MASTGEAEAILAPESALLRAQGLTRSCIPPDEPALSGLPPKAEKPVKKAAATTIALKVDLEVFIML